jgi:DNA-binding NarL/FixJ family response regulator
VPTLRVLIVDDHPVVRASLRHLVELTEGWTVVGEADDGKHAVFDVEQLRPDIVLMDLEMPELDGIEATRQIVERCGTPVLIVSMHADRERVLAALRAGARGFLLKSASHHELHHAIAAVAAGEIWISSTVAGYVVAVIQTMAPATPLTERQLQVLRQLGRGMSAREVAQVLGIGVKTVESHRAEIMRRLDIATISDLVRYAMALELDE